MAGKSDFLENEILDHVLSRATYTAPATVYLALYTVAPDDTAASGTEVTTAGDTDYARLAITNDATNFPAAASGAKSNGVEWEFPPAGTDPWGTIVAFAIKSAITAGDTLYWGLITPNKAIGASDVAKFPAGSLAFSET